MCEQLALDVLPAPASVCDSGGLRPLGFEGLRAFREGASPTSLAISDGLGAHRAVRSGAAQVDAFRSRTTLRCTPA